MIEALDLRKQYSRPVLRDVTFAVGEGEIVALVGPNGAGKSTLLRIFATTVVPDAGTARVAGADVVANGQAARGRIGVVYGEDRGWYWRLSGARNLEFFGALHKLGGQALRGRVAELLVRFGLQDDGGRRVGEYSTGMRSRLGLARALLHSPAVLLLDEPASHLDAPAADALHECLVELAGEGTAVLFATHDLAEAARADRVVVLAPGSSPTVVTGATPARLRHAVEVAGPD